MGRPTIGDVHTNAVLTNMCIKITPAGLIASECAPVVPVVKESDKYRIYNRSDWARNEAALIPEGGEAPFSSFNWSTETYNCEVYGHKTPLSRRVKANADSDLRLQQQAGEHSTGKVLLKREIRVATLFFEDGTPSNWTNNTTLSGTDQWNDEVNSAPVTVIDTANESVRQESGGRFPTQFIIGAAAWVKLMRHPDIVGLVFGGGYAGPRVVTPELFAKAFGYKKVLVGYSQYCTSAEGTAEASCSYSDIWGKHAWIGYVTDSPSIFEPSAVYAFRNWFRVRTWYNDSTDTDWVEASENIDEKLTSAECGYLIANCVA